MYKPRDNDIFGTSQIGFAPRIENNSFIDPNAAFKKKTEQNYERVSSKVTNVPRTITAKGKDSSTVNEKVQFEDDYHRSRKQMDMQSSIFYPPTHASRIQERNTNQPSINNIQDGAFGRKETLNREIKNLPYNAAQIKGNSSRLFDFDPKIQKKQNTKPLTPLIPCQMQWDQHDSIKYSHINDQNKNTLNKRDSQKQISQTIDNVEQSKSTYFPPNKDKEAKKKIQEKPEEKTLNKVKSEGKIGVNNKTNKDKDKQPIEIKILKGWDFKLMEGLSKFCKLNKVTIVKFEIGEKDLATISISRSERWENITDWMRKDAKLKIRVMNN